MKIIKRIIQFDNKDWKHISWLISMMFKGWWNGDWKQIVESWFWLRIHLEYDSKKIN
jgi:hypothetical protein